jgi:uncharacterized cupin superfamily protein
MNSNASKGPAAYVVRTRELGASDGVTLRHPLNPKSEILFHRLSEKVGMQRAHMNFGRIPPGKESFVPHAHGSTEEFLFIIEGDATLEVNGQKLQIGAGDYVGFPVDGAVHHMTNTGSRDLVYLMGGERSESEVARFPTLRKIGIWHDGVMRYVDEDSGVSYAPSDFVARGNS